MEIIRYTRVDSLTPLPPSPPDPPEPPFPPDRPLKGYINKYTVLSVGNGIAYLFIKQ
jgi:hypothetical protein